MHPISSKNFGNVPGQIAVTFHNGTDLTTNAYIVKQLGSKTFIVSNGTITKTCRLVQNDDDADALDGGDLTLCLIEATPHGGSLEKVRAIFSKTLVTIDGDRYTYQLGVASAATGEATMAVIPNSAPTVANAIPNQSGTVAGAFSYVIPANTFADANGDTLTLSATLVGGAAVTTIGFAFNASTRTLSKLAGASTTGTKSFRITATDTRGGSVYDDFDVVLS